MNIKKLLNSLKKIKDNDQYTMEGWILANRGNEKIRFLSLNDGSTSDNLQIVIKGKNILDFKIDKINLGTSVKVSGTLILTPKSPQPVELVVSTLEIINTSDDDYPIQKKETTLDFLREIPHLRHKTNLFRTIMLIRNSLVFELHKYFQENGFINVASPIITSNDCEGAGETLEVNNPNNKNDYFFKERAYLGVSGQLHAEAYANGFKKVYTFAPTFRAENSHTSRHLAEFWMVEPEVAFANLNDVILLADNLLKTIIANTLKNYPSEMKILNDLKNGTLIPTLKDFINKDLKILDYKEAIKILEKNKKMFEDQNIFFGMDLSSEHEKFIAEKIVNGPVALINYPKELKAFYMYQNTDNKTVAAFDLLVPGIGELMGGSQRESRYKKLEQRLKELNIKQEPLQWYLDLRRYGYAPSSGFGIGFERLVMYVTGISNIRDVIPFPRTPGGIKM